MSTPVNRIGFGVDLEGGEAVLSQLKAIYDYERRLVELTGRSSGGSAPSAGRGTINEFDRQNKQREREERESGERRKTAQIQIARELLKLEIGANTTKVEEDRRANERMARNAIETKTAVLRKLGQMDQEYAKKTGYNPSKPPEGPMYGPPKPRTEDEMYREGARLKRLGYPMYGPAQETIEQGNIRRHNEILKKGGSVYGPDPKVIDEQVGLQMKQASAERRKDAEAQKQLEEFQKRNADRTLRDAENVRQRRFAEQKALRDFKPNEQQQGILDRAYSGPDGTGDPNFRNLNAMWKRLAFREAGIGTAGPQAGKLPRSPALLDDQRRREGMQLIEQMQIAPQAAQLDKARDQLGKFRQEADKINFRRVGTEVSAEAAKMSRNIAFTQLKAEQLREELAKPANMRRSAAEIEKDLAHIDSRVNSTTEKLRQLRLQEQNTPGGGGPPGNKFGRFGGDGNDNPFGALQTAQRIGRNLLIYAAVRGFTTDLQEFITSSVEAARVSEETTRQLQFQSQAAHLNFSANLSVATSLARGARVSQTAATRAVSEALQLTQEGGRPQDTGEVARALADINAKRGKPFDKLAETAQSVQLGGRGFQQLFGVRADDLVKQEAERRVIDSEKSGVAALNENGTAILGHKQRVEALVASLTDEEKVSIRINELLRQGAEVQGAAAERAGTQAGKIELLGQRYEDAKVAVGNFLLSLTPLDNILSMIEKRLEGIDPTKLKVIGTGQGGQITNADILRYSQAAPDTGAAKVSNAINQYAGSAALGLGLTGAALFVGRGTAATEQRQSIHAATYESVYGQTENAALAQSEAQAAATGARPGIIKSIQTGTRLITTSVSARTLEMFSGVAKFVGAEGTGETAATMANRIRTGTQELEGAAAVRANRFASNGATAGGLLGGAVGAELGAMTARSLNVGPLVATALTVTGAIIGTTVGTSLGSLAGGALAGAVPVASTLGSIATAVVSAPTIIAAGVGAAALIATNLYTDPKFEAGAREDAISAATNKAILEQREQMDTARKTGQTFFREKGAFGDTDVIRPDDFRAGVASGKYNEGNYEEAIESPAANQARLAREAAETKGNEQMEKIRGAFLNRRLEAEAKTERELLARQELALGKLRDFTLNGYQLIEGTASKLAEDNPYVKLFADGATAAERMQKEWGFLGEATTAYFTNLELRKVALGELKQDYTTLNSVSGKWNEARQLELRRNVGLTGTDTRAIEISKTAANAAVQNPELYDLARKYRKQYVQPEGLQLREQYGNLRRADNAIPYDLSAEGRDAAQGVVDEQYLALAQKAGSKIFGGDLQGLRLDAGSAAYRSAQRNDRAVDRAGQKAVIGAQAQSDVDTLLSQSQRLAQSSVAGGKVSSADAQRVLDKQILAVTGAIDPKELSAHAYQGRIDALKREAISEAQDKIEARIAIKTAETQRKEMIEISKAIRDAILKGGGKALIQVTNDTQARIDQEDLEDAHGGNQVVTFGSNPGKTSPSKGRY